MPREYREGRAVDGERDPVAPTVLAVIHGGVCDFQQFARACRVIGVRRDADARGDRHVHPEVARAHRLAKPLCTLDGADFMDAPHDCAELVAAVARREIDLGYRMFAQQVRHTLQHDVARGMPERVIHAFEMIGVDEPQRDRSVAAQPGERQFLLQYAAKRARRMQTGQPVVRRAAAIDLAFGGQSKWRCRLRDGAHDEIAALDLLLHRRCVHHRRHAAGGDHRDGDGGTIRRDHRTPAACQFHAVTAQRRARRQRSRGIAPQPQRAKMLGTSTRRMRADELLTVGHENKDGIYCGFQHPKRAVERGQHRVGRFARGGGEHANRFQHVGFPAQRRIEARRGMLAAHPHSRRVGAETQTENGQSNDTGVHWRIVPITREPMPQQPLPAAAEANRRGVALRSQGRLSEAAQAFREGICAQPGLAVLHVNLATTLVDAGDMDAAQHEYETALESEPDCLPALQGLGSLHVRLGRFAQARECFERVLAADENDMNAHLSMYELEQIDGNIPKALAHQRRVLQRQSLFSAYAPNERRRLLVLAVPGDWQANVPVDFLVDARTTTLHKFYLLSRERALSVQLPPADVVFTAIGESDESLAALHVAEELIGRLRLPHINDPRNIAAANRFENARRLGAIPHVHAPQTQRVAREALAAHESGIPYPLLVRPVGSQAGRDLARIADGEELHAYLSRVADPVFYVIPFVDFKRDDGYYRKYRIIVVDGVPYPYHLAISPNWMIHYYNAPMRETPWMRGEEAYFLEHFDRVFAPELRQALHEMAGVLGLEYFGVDCSIDSQGRLLLFEADPAMVVHAGDDPALFAYKFPHAQRIFDAFQRLIDRVGSR